MRAAVLLTLLFVAVSSVAASPVKDWEVPFDTLQRWDLQGATFFPLTPCRVADTRNPDGFYGGPILAANTSRNFDIDDGACPGIPENAAAFSLNVTIVGYNPAAGGYITVYPFGAPQPFVSTINFGAGHPIANAVIVASETAGWITIYASATTHVIIDVNGYFVDANTTMNPGQQVVLLGSSAGLFSAHNQSTETDASAIFGRLTGAAQQGAAVRGHSVSGAPSFGVDGAHFGSDAGSAGVRGYSESPLSINPPAAGVRGSAQNGDGVQGYTPLASAKGVFGAQLTCGASCSEVAAGALGHDGYGVYAFGDTGATGTKSFIEPHPTDASKVIRYVSLEGPEAGTYFRGTGRFVKGRATIDVPEDFRMVTDTEGLTVHVTPMGRMAMVGVVDASLDRIEVESSRDVEFSYIVHGVRRGFADFRPVAEKPHFAPADRDARLPEYLNADQKQRLIDNGTYHADGTVNLGTALRLGWDKQWREQQH